MHFTRSQKINEPIFWSVVDDMRAAGYDVPWCRTGKETHAGIFEGMSYLLHEHAGMAVRNPNDFIKIVNPA